MANLIDKQGSSFSFEEIDRAKKITNYQSHDFINSDGLKITYYSFIPENAIAKIIFIHGGGACSKLGYFNFAEKLKENFNIQAILMDLVGHGDSEGTRGDCVSIESVYKDISQLAKIVNVDKKPIYLGGHSSGGGLVLNYSSWIQKALFNGYFFVSPEFGYKSKTERNGRIDFAKIKIGKFILNALSGGKIHQHAYAVELNYPKEILKSQPLIVSKLTVNMANALTPPKPKKQMSKVKEPIAIFIGENDELFDPIKVVAYEKLQKIKNPKSTSKIITKENHLSILLNIGNEIGKTINDWKE